MQIRPHRIINRKKTREIKVGNISVGGGSPISVQSMTNTITSDVKSTVKQILSLEEAGADIVRVSCPDESSTKALKNGMKTEKLFQQLENIRNEIDIPLILMGYFNMIFQYGENNILNKCKSSGVNG